MYTLTVDGMVTQHATERAAIDAALAPRLATSPAGTTAAIGAAEITIRFADGRELELPLCRDAAGGLAIVYAGTTIAEIDDAAAPKISYAKLKSGAWGIRIPGVGQVNPGELVAVAKKSGDRQAETVDRIVYAAADGSYSLASIVDRRTEQRGRAARRAQLNHYDRRDHANN